MLTTAIQISNTTENLILLDCFAGFVYTIHLPDVTFYIICNITFDIYVQILLLPVQLLNPMFCR